MLVERDAQLAALREAVAMPGGRLVLVTAEAGAGKTSLIRALVATATQRVLIGGCDSLHTARPYGPLLDWAADTRSDLVDLVRSGGAQMDILDGALDLVSAVPTIAVIEDIHWADGATFDLLVHLGRRIATTESTLLVTYRPEEATPGSSLALTLGDLLSSHPVRLPVPPLTLGAVATLAADYDVDAADLHRRTEGNAFFVTECLASPDDVPQTVRDAVLARVHRLDPPAIAAARIVSTFPGSVRLDDATSLGAEATGLDDAIDNGVLVLSADTVGFRHELARIAISASMPASDRRRMHRLALDLVETRQPVDEAAAVHHAVEAGDTAGIARHAGPAAAQAEGAGARHEAIAHLELALRVVGTDDRMRIDLLARLGALYDETGDFDRSVAAFDAAADLSDAPELRANFLLKSCSPLTMAGRLDTAGERLDEAIGVLESLPPGPALALAWAQRCSLLMLGRRLREAEPWGTRAMELAAEYQDHATLAYVQIQSGTALFMTGDTSGYARVRDGVETARAHGIDRLVAHGLSQFGCGGGEMRAYEAAMPMLEECIGYASDRGLHSRGLYSQAWLGRCQVERGQWDAATTTLSEVLSSARCTGVTRITALTALGRMRARRGDPDPWGPLDEALEMAQQTGQLQRLWPVATARAEAAWLAGHPQTETATVAAVLEQARHLEQPWATGELAVWAARSGTPARPTDEVAEPYALELAGRRQEAARVWIALGCPYDAAAVLAHSPDDADQIQALTTWRAIGAPAGVARLTELRRVAGLRVPRGPNAATLNHVAGLTSRELDVLDLLASGLTNREIGERIHLSSKTVGHHVSHILTKLDVTNRTEAVRAALRLGIGSAGVP